MHKRVSVIIPVYNTKVWMLKQCFASIEVQTLPVFEMIVVDDGSTDQQTIEYLNWYSNNHDAVRLMYNSHGGIGKARNTGIFQAKGDYICFIDSDDFWDNDFVETMVETAERSDAEIVYCGYRYSSNDGKDTVSIEPSDQVLKNANKFPYFTPGCGFRLYKLSFIKEYECFFPEQCILEDTLFTYKVNLFAENKEVVMYHGYNVRSGVNDSACRDRKKINCATVDTVPYKEIEALLVKTSRQMEFRSRKAKFDLLVLLAEISWLIS